MNWSVIILGLVALSSVAIAENTYLVIVPKLLKVGHDNQLSVFIAASSQAVDVKFELTIGHHRIQGTTSVKSGETRNATLTLPREFPVGPGVLTIVGTGGVRFEEKRDVIVYDNRNVILVQTSASNYQPGDILRVRVVATNEELMPLEKEVALIEIYDANLKLVGEFENVTVRSGLTETHEFPLSRHCTYGTWLVSATIGNTTSSLEVTVSAPITPSFDLKAIFQRFLLRTDKTLRGIIEIDNDQNEAIFGRATIAVNHITEESMQTMMKQRDEQRRSQSEEQPKPVEEWRQWKQQSFEIAGRVEINYDLASLFNVDVSKALAVQVYIQVVDLVSGQERFIQHVIPIFTHDVIYDIRPLEFEAGIKNEFEIIAKRPDGKPAKMEDLIVTVTMILGNEQGKVQEEKSVEIKDFYTRGRNDIAFFNIELPQNCIGVLMTIAPLSEDGKVRGYRTHAMPLMPTPRRGVSGGKLSIELSPPTSTPAQTNGNTLVVSSQIPTVRQTSNFYIQVLPSKQVEKFEPLPMSYMVLTNGRITLTGDFTLQPTKECRSRTQRAIKPEEQKPPVCVFNGTLPIQVTRTMLPYSTLLVYTFQPSFGFNVAESYKFAVAGLFKDQLTLNATIVPFTAGSTLPEDEDSREEYESHVLADSRPISISHRAQGKSRVELSFTGAADSTVGLNVFEYDAITQGLTNEVTKERVLQYLTAYEQVPIVGMPTRSQSGEESTVRPVRGEKSNEDVKQWKNEDPKKWKNEDPKKWKNEGGDYKSSSSDKVSSDKKFGQRAVLTEEEEQKHINQERLGFKVRYPIERMVFGIASSRGAQRVEGDDPYTTPNLGRLYGDVRTQRSQSIFRRRGGKQSGQYDVSVSDNEYVVATSFPMIVKAGAYHQRTQERSRPQPQQESGKQQSNQEEVEVDQQDGTQEPRDPRPQYGSTSWYEKMNSKLSSISQEAFTFMQSGLSVVTDFPSLHVPQEMRRTNLTKLFSRFRTQSRLDDPESFSRRDEARQLLEEYISEGDLSMLPPPIVLEEQARTGYYRSIFFNTSRIEAQGTGKVVLPRTKPYSTWLATGFALNTKSGLSVAHPVRLPTNHGLYILGNLPDQLRIGEQVLLPYGINNYLGKDLTNVILRIRASADFDLIEQNQPERVVSSIGKDYTITIPALKSLGVETRTIVLVPKRAGVIKVVLEVESEFGGDYEVLTSFVRESGIRRRQLSGRLFDLTSETKTYGPIVEKISQSPFLRSVKLVVSGTNLERLVSKDMKKTNSLVGVDHSIVRLWRLLNLRWYLNETSQVDSKLDSIAEGNLTLAYQKLQFYSEYDGSYSFISAQGEQEASLYLTTLALGAMLSPFMPIHDNVTINRSLTWILSRQQQDGSFDDQGACYHYRICGGEFRREALTAVVYYALTRNNISEMVPEFVRRPLYNGEQSPILRAQRYLESRLDAVKSSLVTTTLVELALVGSRSTSEQLKQRIFQNVRARQLTVVPEDGSRYLKNVDEQMNMDDQILINSMTLSIYQLNGDLKTVLDMARWIVKQRDVHPFYDTVLDLIFRTEAWIRTDLLFRQRHQADKISVVVDVTIDKEQKQFKINAANMDVSQYLNLTLPVNQITYKVSGFGLVDVCVKQVYIEKQPQEPKQPVPFQLTQELSAMPWLNEIAVKTFVTYTPTVQDRQLAKDTFNRTIVVEVQIPSGFRLNLRQIGFFLSDIPEALYFTHDDVTNKISFFLNIPSTSNGKQICLKWYLERLSVVSQWAPIQIRAYDYLRPECQFVRLFPVQVQPNNLLGYSFVDTFHKNRPSFEQIAKMQQVQTPSKRV